jgi:hypothetical protein
MLQRRQREVVGDEEATSQLQSLLRAAAAPYFRILEGWLCGGVLRDPWGDFMVQENLVGCKRKQGLDSRGEQGCGSIVGFHWCSQSALDVPALCCRSPAPCMMCVQPADWRTAAATAAAGRDQGLAAPGQPGCVLDPALHHPRSARRAGPGGGGRALLPAGLQGAGAHHR